MSSSVIRNRLDDGSLVRRFQLVPDAAPLDAARACRGERVEEEERSRQRPQQKVRPHSGAELRVEVFEDERGGAQTKEGFPDAEQKDDRDERERPRVGESERGTRGGERESAEEGSDEEEVRDEGESPKVRR